MSAAWKVGQKVRFLGAYQLPISAEDNPVQPVPAGARGVVVRVNPESIWVRVDGRADSVTLWFPGAFPDDVAKTSLLEKLSG